MSFLVCCVPAGDEAPAALEKPQKSNLGQDLPVPSAAESAPPPSDSAVAQVAVARDLWRRRADFPTDGVYGRYVQAVLEPGMRIRMLRDDGPVRAGDSGEFVQTNGGRPPLQGRWDRTGSTYWVEWSAVEIVGTAAAEQATELAGEELRGNTRQANERKHAEAAPAAAAAQSDDEPAPEQPTAVPASGIELRPGMDSADSAVLGKADLAGGAADREQAVIQHQRRGEYAAAARLAAGTALASDACLQYAQQLLAVSCRPGCDEGDDDDDDDDASLVAKYLAAAKAEQLAEKVAAHSSSGVIATTVQSVARCLTALPATHRRYSEFGVPVGVIKEQEVRLLITEPRPRAAIDHLYKTSSEFAELLEQKAEFTGVQQFVCGDDGFGRKQRTSGRLLKTWGQWKHAEMRMTGEMLSFHDLLSGDVLPNAQILLSDPETVVQRYRSRLGGLDSALTSPTLTHLVMGTSSSSYWICVDWETLETYGWQEVVDPGMGQRGRERSAELLQSHAAQTGTQFLMPNVLKALDFRSDRVCGYDQILCELRSALSCESWVLAMLPVLDPKYLGVTTDGFAEFMSENEDVSGHTVAETCGMVKDGEVADACPWTGRSMLPGSVVRKTEELRCCYVDLWRSHPEMTRWIGLGNVFVSHAWHETIGSLREGVQYYDEHLREAGVLAFEIDSCCYWIDIFCKNQWVVNSGDTEAELASCVHRAARAAGNPPEVVLVASPWPHPTTLTRVWCLFEIMKAASVGAQITVTTSVAGQRSMVEFTSAPDFSAPEFGNWGSRETYGNGEIGKAIDIQQAQATVPSDKDYIMGKVAEVPVDEEEYLILLVRGQSRRLPNPAWKLSGVDRMDATTKFWVEFSLFEWVFTDPSAAKLRAAMQGERAASLRLTGFPGAEKAGALVNNEDNMVGADGNAGVQPLHPLDVSTPPASWVPVAMLGGIYTAVEETAGMLSHWSNSRGAHLFSTRSGAILKFNDGSGSDDANIASVSVGSMKGGPVPVGEHVWECMCLPLRQQDSGGTWSRVEWKLRVDELSATEREEGK